MAILLYNNGITEEYRSGEHTFTDNEILSVLRGFANIRSHRLPDIPNTWCVWGQRNPINRKEDEFSYLGSEVLEQPCYSPILFIHDTEMDPSWGLTDEIIIQGYDDFRDDISHFLNDIAKDIIDERKRIREENGEDEKTPVIEPFGVSKDKRVIYKFDIDKQPKDFFLNKNLAIFADKVHKFLKFSYKDGDTFAIYADKQMIFVLEDDKVQHFVSRMVAFFESQENYEACSILRNTYDKWNKFKKKKEKENSEGKNDKEENGEER
jgi:hypothetical protein